MTSFTDIITPPQVAILGTARLERAVVHDGKIVARRIVTATVFSAHRVLDGVSAAEWLATLKHRLEGPDAWFAERA